VPLSLDEITGVPSTKKVLAAEVDGTCISGFRVAGLSSLMCTGFLSL
jgi:hypothetical protein